MQHLHLYLDKSRAQLSSLQPFFWDRPSKKTEANKRNTKEGDKKKGPCFKVACPSLLLCIPLPPCSAGAEAEAADEESPY